MPVVTGSWPASAHPEVAGPVHHGAFIISPTVDGYLVPGDAVVDVNGEWVTRHVPGRADLRCLGRDL